MLGLFCILFILYVGADDPQPNWQLTGTKRLESLYGDVGQDGLFILSEFM